MPERTEAKARSSESEAHRPKAVPHRTEAAPPRAGTAPPRAERAVHRRFAGTCRPHPGDVSRRVALLREELGLSREELALRAGMAPSFVQYVEEQSDTISTGPLLRLAAALRTTAAHLLGAVPGGPPSGLHELGLHECWDRLAEHGFGRVALSTADGPAVIPVGYAVEGRAIVCHACPGAGVCQPPPGTEVAFEVDQVDEAMGSGWSVLVIGTVDRPAADSGDRSRVRVTPERVSGRIIRAD
jgi:transcriptional regulator with XRE-family HTH domain